MLLSVSFYVTATTLPATLVYVLETEFPEGDLTMSDLDIARDPTWTRFHRAMHFSAKRGFAIACRLSLCLSLCL